MTELVNGRIVGQGPVKTAPHPYGSDVAYLANEGTPRPPDLPPSVPFMHVLPMEATIDKATLKNNWVQITSPKINGVAAWCELPRFQAEETPPEPPEPPATGKKYRVELTVTGTITEV